MRTPLESLKTSLAVTGEPKDLPTSFLREKGSDLRDSFDDIVRYYYVSSHLGVSVDTVQMTISITVERMEEISNLLTEWKSKQFCTRKELRSIIGKLSFVSKCVRQSRVFLSRLLELLRSINWKPYTRIEISEDFRKDLRWWELFMERFNGVAFIPSSIWTEPDVSMATDSCLSGCGGISSNEYFHAEFPPLISK